MNLTGKTALVTGSTSGIGLGIAQVLAQAGATLILNGFGDVDAAKDAVAQYGKTPGYHGADLSDALLSMANRWDLDDIRMFVVSVAVQNETGGNLSEILENLSRVIRARANMFMKVRALSSEGRMTAWMLTALPILTLIAVFLINPAFYLDVAQDRMFLIGFPGLIVLYTVGVLTIRRIIDLKV